MTAMLQRPGFHYVLERNFPGIFHFPQLWITYETKFTYSFENFFHPYVGRMLERLSKAATLAEFFDPAFHKSLQQTFFNSYYTPLNSQLVEVKSFDKKIETNREPYANYNWELLFHVPLTIATHLSKNQRFAEARKWFHFIFDPTTLDDSVAAPDRYWRFIGFREASPNQRIDVLLEMLSDPTVDPAKKKEITDGWDAVRNHPFKPHAVARTRTVAYQYSVVMKYLDNLIAWGDSLFVQDTIETINEATLLYVQAAKILGPRPEQIPPRGKVRPKTFAQLKKAGLDAMGNALVELEAQFPFDFSIPKGDGDNGGQLFGIGRTLYFCVPRNDKLMSYWDKVEDRLYKIRHCMNIEGVVRPLALFDPPIDPGMLVKAAAAGIDIGTIVNGLNQPLGPLRSLPLVQKALELAGEVRSFGGSLLSAIEKQDTEHLSRMRQQHEIAIQKLSQELRFLQWKQAESATETLLRTRASALERYKYYLRMQGSTPDGSLVPDTFTPDRRELTEENFDDAYAALVTAFDLAVPLQDFPKLKISGDASPSNASGSSSAGNLHLIANEDAELNQHLPTARDTRLAASVGETIASILTFIPEFNVDLHFWGLGASAKVIGGSKLADAVKIVSEILRTVSVYETDQAGMAARTAGHERRADEWILQANLAAHELAQIGRQLIGSLIAEQAARREYLNVQQQIANSEEIDAFLRSKFTSEELFAYLQGEISRLHYEYYRFAFDMARKAERSIKLELMRPELDATTFIQFNYWDGGRKGLLAGEALHLDLKRMEVAYHENNKRELEITKHVSLRQLDPIALLTLRTTGRCQVTIPEWLYDIDCPGHYMRRMKSVAVSLPSVVGPYASVSCTLSLLRSTLRTSSLLKDGAYARDPSGDDRFTDSFGAIQSIVTSSGSNDNGMFETNLRDERFLPFEGAGAVSTWQLDLPKDFHAFDYTTLTDVVLHVRYTARQGGDALGTQAVKELREDVFAAGASGLTLLFSLRHDFPSEWSSFVTGTGDLSITVRRSDFPYFVQGKDLSLDSFDLYGDGGGKVVHRNVAAGTQSDDLKTKGEFTMTVPADANVLRRTSDDVFLVIRYSM